MKTTLSYNAAVKLGFVSIGNMWLRCPHCSESVRVGRESFVHSQECDGFRKSSLTILRDPYTGYAIYLHEPDDVA